MARDRELDSAESNANSAPLPGFVDTPNAAGSPFMGPVDRTAATAPLGMTGKQRFDYVMTQAPGAMQTEGHDYDTWLMNLPEDPADVQYTQMLRDAKSNAAARIRMRAQQGDKPIAQLTGPDGSADVPKVTATPGKATTPPAAGPGSLPGSPGTKKLDLEEQKQHRLESAGAPLIQGLPVKETDVLKDPNNPAGTPDPYVQEWVKGKNLELENQDAQIAAKSGKWVYTGEVADPAGGKFYSRSMYIYVDDAQAMIGSFTPADIKKYQKQLGQPETGTLTPQIQNVWDAAVDSAARYARAGKKVELKWIFEQLIASEVAAKAAAGGGGGRFGNESGADMVGADYYQAMLAVMGDISGVGKVA